MTQTLANDSQDSVDWWTYFDIIIWFWQTHHWYLHWPTSLSIWSGHHDYVGGCTTGRVDVPRVWLVTQQTDHSHIPACDCTAIGYACAHGHGDVLESRVNLEKNETWQPHAFACHSHPNKVMWFYGPSGWSSRRNVHVIIFIYKPNCIMVVVSYLG